jgi:hypothetical protein
MTLITALIGGLACGYLLTRRQTAIAVWLVMWAVVLPVQTRFLVNPENVADWSYWPVQAAIFGVAMGMIGLGAKLRARRSRTSQPPGQVEQTLSDG